MAFREQYVSSISEWTGLIVRDRQQGRQQVTVPWATGTANPTSPTGPRAAPPIPSPARVSTALYDRITPPFPLHAVRRPRAGVVSPFLTGHPQP